MNLLQILAGSSSSGGTSVKTYADDVFATHLYMGTGAMRTLTDIPYKDTTLLHVTGTGLTDLSVSPKTLTGTSIGTSASVTKFKATSIQLTNANTSKFTLSSSISFDSTEAWTVEMWVYRTAYAGAGSYTILFGGANQTVIWQNSGQLWGFGIGAPTDSGPVFPNNTWVHIAVVNDPGVGCSLYGNGNRQHLGTNISLQPTNQFFNYISDGWGMAGYADDIIISSIAKYSGSSFTLPTSAAALGVAAKVSLLWIKNRSAGNSHQLYLSNNPVKYPLVSDTSAAHTYDPNGLIAFNGNGVTLGVSNNVNGGDNNLVAWRFTEAAKFFDVVKYTGNGVARTITHSLGIAPGLILVKRTETGPYDWQVYHRSMSNTEHLVLNSTAAKVTGSSRWNSTTPTTSGFNLDGDATVNESGGSYVAYIFAHDTSADGLIQCGLITASGTTQSINLGWEPQFLLFKANNSSRPWYIIDTARGWSLDKDTVLSANSSGTEASYANSYGPFVPTATGFQINSDGWDGAGLNYVYMAIRRPNKPPTSGTQVYNAIARTGTGTATTVTGVGFAPDFVMSKDRSAVAASGTFDRLRGAGNVLIAHSSASQYTGYLDTLSNFDLMDGFKLGNSSTLSACNSNGIPYINYCLKRAVGVFDIVSSTNGQSTADVYTTIKHNLGVIPELVIAKQTSQSSSWFVHAPNLASHKMLYLDAASAAFTNTGQWTPAPDAVNIYPGNQVANGNNVRVIYYLFASKAGISKVGMYTGNGTGQTVDCGFAAGARFLLIKRTDSTGDWFVFDATRGIVAGNDAHSSINSSAAEVTSDDSVDPTSSGFIVNQVADTNINVNAATYLYLAIA